MRVKFLHLLPGILSLMLLVAYSASAQDDMPVPVPGPSNNNSTIFTQDPAVYDDKPLLMEQNTGGLKLPDTLQHRSIATPTVRQKDQKKPQGEGDPLNFNFLYYIIQKFKASEVME